MTVRVTPGPVGSAATRVRAEAVQALRATQLDRARQAADKWRTGLVGALALITAVSVIKGRETIEDLTPGYRLAVALSLLSALIIAVVGAHLGMRASFGSPNLQPLTGDPSELLDWEQSVSSQTVRDIHSAAACTYFVLAFLALGVGLTWFGPVSPPAYVSVTSNDGSSICGSLDSGNAKVIAVRSDGEEIKIPTREVKNLTIKKTC